MTSVDFLLDDAFVHHQLAPTPASAALWDGYLTLHPGQKDAYKEAKELLDAVRLGLDRYARTTLPEETIQQLLVKIRAINARQPRPKPVARRWWRPVAAAAGLAVVLAGAAVWQHVSRPVPAYVRHTQELKETSIEKINGRKEPQTYQLPDGSEVVLFPGSRMSYPTDFNRKTRTVYLSGEASFSVTKNAGIPFLVYANDVVTKVIGTKFVVRAFEGEQEVRVNVQSGRVSVYQYKAAATAAPQAKGVLLLPNQQVVFSKLTEQFTKSLIALPHLLPGIGTPRFSYDETPVAQVFRDLEKAYGITILYNEESLGHCQLNASLAALSFEEKLGVICTTFGTRYEVIDGQVILTGGGCE